MKEFPTLSFQGRLCQGKLILQTIPVFKQLSLPLGWFSLCLILQSIINGSLRKAMLLQALRTEFCGLRFSGKIKITFLQHRLLLICWILVILVILLSFNLLVRGFHTVNLRLTSMIKSKRSLGPKFSVWALQVNMHLPPQVKLRAHKLDRCFKASNTAIFTFKQN